MPGQLRKDGLPKKSSLLSVIYRLTVNFTYYFTVTFLLFLTVAFSGVILFGLFGYWKAEAQEAIIEVTSDVALSGLQNVRERGFVRCGTVDPQPGFAQINGQGDWVGMDVDFCRGLAVVLFGEETKFEFQALEGESRFVGLQTGSIDVLVRNGAWTLERDTQFGVDYVGALFYDGQAFMTRASLEKISAREFDDQSICVLNNSEHLLNLSDFFFEIQTSYTPVMYETMADLQQAYGLGLCDVMSARLTELAATRAVFDVPEDHVILPEILSKEPFGPTVKAGEAALRDIVFWTLNSLILAEELGLTSQSVVTMEQSPSFAVRQFLGLEGPFAGDAADLPRDWGKTLIARIGNYGEIFERHFGARSLLKMRRGQNALSGAGGIHLAYPLN